MTAAGRGRDRQPFRAAAVGISTSSICGVRDHATLLARALSLEHVSCSMHWLNRVEGSLCAAQREIRSLNRGLAAELRADQPQALLLHYSVFPFSYRGIPVFVRPTLAALRSSRVPLVTVLHEFAYPWMRDGLRGTAWAVSQRMLLIDVMRASAAVVLTTDFRVPWLTSRRWLPRRRVVVAPVFSNLPPSAIGAQGDRERPVVGVFGYAYQRETVFLVLDAVRELADRGSPLQLRLLGAPGHSSPAGEAWRAAAHARALTDAVSFSDTLSAQQLSDGLAACDILLFADPSGPASRKTTLAASLASGRPVVALDGPQGWPELIRSEAALVVPLRSAALGNALGALLHDESAREALGARGRAFAERSMSAGRSAHVVADLLRDVVHQAVS
jgi:glycosyltransferase involved in cell wall biosynthesis